MVDGSHVGTTSNGDGSFTITAPGNGSLVVSFIGYETQKVAIGGKTRINISLKEDAQAIDDVIVVAFGTAKKDAFTGAAKVTNPTICKNAVFDVGDALGRAKSPACSSPPPRAVRVPVRRFTCAATVR